MPGPPLSVVDGAGLPVVYVREGALLVSPLAGELLTDEELGAMALQALSIRPGGDRQFLLRYYGPWGAALLVAGAVSLYTRFPWIVLVGLAMLFWTQRAARRRTLGRAAMEANVRFFLERGGDAPALLRGMIKSLSAVVRSGVNQPMVVTQLRAVAETVARLGSIDQAEVDRLMAVYGAPPELSRAGVR